MAAKTIGERPKTAGQSELAAGQGVAFGVSRLRIRGHGYGFGHGFPVRFWTSKGIFAQWWGRKLPFEVYYLSVTRH